MELIKPVYFDTFRCIAGACPDSCCKGWAVQVDDASAAYYRRLPGALGDKLRKHLTVEDGDTILALEADGRCPMWCDDGLCRLQSELGEDALCHTCHEFPRLRHDYGDFIEVGLELSCPEAARILLDRKDCAVTVAHLSGGDAPEYDADAMAILRATREIALDFLTTSRLSVGETLAVFLLYGHAAQSQLDGGDTATLDAAKNLETAHRLAQSGNAESILDFYSRLEILDSSWAQRLRSPAYGQWLPAHLAIAHYFVERYWLQAVSDYDLVGRVNLTVLSCLVIKTLGGDVYETAQRYSKEIENDADNLDAILDGAYTAPAFADRALLGLLLQ